MAQLVGVEVLYAVTLGKLAHIARRALGVHGKGCAVLREHILTDNAVVDLVFPQLSQHLHNIRVNVNRAGLSIFGCIQIHAFLRSIAKIIRNRDMLSTVAAGMTAALDKAVGALVGVLDDPNASPGLKVNAANALLNHANRYIESANILRRLEALEQKEGEENA